MFGLNSDPTTDANYTSLDYAFYCSIGNAYIYENGTQQGSSLGSYTTSDVFTITYDGYNVRYYKNGSVQRTVARSIGSALYFDSSFYQPSSEINSVGFGPMGEAGTQGTQGTQGASIQGTQGTQGASIQGTQGASIQGTQGTQGASIQGTQGASIQGVQGIQGTQGTSIQGVQGISPSTADFITNTPDTYTGTAKAMYVVTLSQAEYNAIGTKDANTLYIII